MLSTRTRNMSSVGLARPSCSRLSRTALLSCVRPLRRPLASPPSALDFGEPARPVALPGALWLLNPFQDKYYNIRGPDFVICRGESGALPSSPARGAAPAQPRRALHQLPAQSSSSSNSSAATPTFAEMLQLAVLSDPGSMVLYDITDIIEPVLDADAEAVCMSLAVMPVVVAGMVHQPGDPEEEEVVEGVYETSSNSPRRTSKMRFLCHRCDAVNIKPVNPAAFRTGTVVATCERCQCKHKIVDHLHVYDDSLLGHTRPAAGGSGTPRMLTPPRLGQGDIPASLRLGMRPLF